MVLKTRRKVSTSIDKKLARQLELLSAISRIDQSKLFDMALEELFKLPRFADFMEEIEEEIRKAGEMNG